MRKFDIEELKNLDLENLGEWPFAIKVTGLILTFLIVITVSWQSDIRNLRTHLSQLELKENELRFSFEKKQRMAANLPALKEQLKDIEETFGDLLKRLPSEAEIAELLVDISQQGLGAGLEFELFQPKEEEPQGFYVRLPIDIRVTGTYHQFGNFISGVSDLPRIVTNHNMKIRRDASNGLMLLETTAKTYRYLEEDDEVSPTQ